MCLHEQIKLEINYDLVCVMCIFKPQPERDLVSHLGVTPRLPEVVLPEADALDARVTI